MSTTGANLPVIAVTDDDAKEYDIIIDDVTQRQRSPVEEAFYESFLLQKQSDVDNLYASNIFYSQKHAKEVKHLERQRQVSLSYMERQQKNMMKKMEDLNEAKAFAAQRSHTSDQMLRRSNRRMQRILSAPSAEETGHQSVLERRRGSLPPIEDDLSRSRFLSKSCSNIRSLTMSESKFRPSKNRPSSNTFSQPQNNGRANTSGHSLQLPQLGWQDNQRMMSRSCEDLSAGPFVTNIHSYNSQANYNSLQLDPKTKTKWVPQSPRSAKSFKF